MTFRLVQLVFTKPGRNKMTNKTPQPIRKDPSGFPYDFYHIRIEHGYPDIMYHWHPEFEIIYVHQGTARYHINYDYFNSQAGDIILVQPSNMHSIHPIADKEQVTDTFSIHLDNLGRSTIDSYSQRYLQPIHNGHFQLTNRIQVDMPGYDKIKTCLFEIFDLVKEEKLYYDMMLKSKLHEFLYLLFKFRYVNRHYTDDTYQKYQKLKRLIDYINTHYAENLTIPFLADYFGYSRTHFMTIFKQHTGSSCLEFLLQVRLNKACELLVRSPLPIQTIASQVGFSNLSNFNRQFKKNYQLTPKQYRNQFNKTNHS